MNILPISQWSDLEITLLFGKDRNGDLYWHLGPIIGTSGTKFEVDVYGTKIISLKDYAELEKRINEVQSR